MKNAIKEILLLVCITSLISCNNYGERTNCSVKNIKTLFIIAGVHDKDTGYAHYVLIRGFDRECMDSGRMTKLALTYIDTVLVGQPATAVIFFNSDKDFIPNQASQVMSAINRSCLVAIGVDKKIKIPSDYIFYNQYGERIYWGPRWFPQGDKSR